MKERTLGRTGWAVSEIGYGGWGIGKKWWGAVDDTASRAALVEAWKRGVNFYDTAYVYGDGHSEQLIGAALKNKPAIIATKIPPKNDEWPGNPKTDIKHVFPADWIISCTERSLKKLGRDTIDLTQLHVWTDAWLDNDEWKEAAQKLKTQGKIRAFGVSINDHDPNSALKIVASGLIDTVQVIFNIFDQSPTEKLFPLCQKHRVGVIVRVPFDEGGLTGTLTLKTKFEKGDFRGQYFRGDNLRQTVERVERLKKYLDDATPTLPDLALKFILSHEAVSVVIPGMRQVKHVQANVGAADSAPLSKPVVAALRAEAWNRNFYGWWDE
jgi:aryl-alcohol dehydrogenase-like predicted oxidoreductase